MELPLVATRPAEPTSYFGTPSEAARLVVSAEEPVRDNRYAKFISPLPPPGWRYELRPVVLDRWGFATVEGNETDRQVVALSGLGGEQTNTGLVALALGAAAWFLFG